MRRFLDSVVEQVLSDCGLPQGPVVDLEVVAHTLGAHAVRYADLGAQDGCTVVEGREIIIYLHRSRRLSRQRFTLAHESGHLLLARPGLHLAADRRRGDLLDDERFCNAFAARLLLPTPWLVTSVGRRPPTLGHLRMLAASTRTSLALWVLRLQETFGHKHALLRWRRNADAWTMTSRVGVPWLLQPSVMTSRRAQRLLEQLHSEAPPPPTQTILPLGATGELVAVPAEVLVRARYIMALADFGPAFRHELRHRQDLASDQPWQTVDPFGPAPLSRDRQPR